jgi:very-short-patch-repair endonuclease
MERFVKRARALHASETSAEAKLWYRLRGRRLARWKFRRQHPIDKYVVDFATIEGKLVVEIDGVTHSEPAEVFRDELRTRVLERCGFLVIRFSNVDVYENIGGVLETIESTLRLARS